MTAQLRSELLKIRSTRTVLGLTLCLVGFVVFLVIVSVYAQSKSSLFTSDQQRDLLSVASLAEPFAAIVGILAVTSEFRHGTARPTFLAEPRRWHVIAAKATAGLAAGLGLAVTVLVVAYVLMTPKSSLSRNTSTTSQGNSADLSISAARGAIRSRASVRTRPRISRCSSLSGSRGTRSVYVDRCPATAGFRTSPHGGSGCVPMLPRGPDSQTPRNRRRLR